jgi:hypothetical protein
MKNPKNTVGKGQHTVLSLWELFRGRSAGRGGKKRDSGYAYGFTGWGTVVKRQNYFWRLNSGAVIDTYQYLR